MIQLLACLALLQDPDVYVEKATGLRFGEKYGTLTRGDIHDYAKEGQSHLGVSIQYSLRDEEGKKIMNLNVYVYDFGLKKIPDGADSETIKKQFEQVKGDVASQKGPKGWHSVKHVADGRAKLGDHKGAPAALRSEFETTLKEDGPAMGSLIYLLGHRNRFVKVRVTCLKEAMKTCAEEYERLLADLGRQIKPPPGSKRSEE